MIVRRKIDFSLKKKHVLVMCTLCIGMFFGCGRTQLSIQYPLPASTENLTSESDGASSDFQTSLRATEVLEFYRNAFIAQGLVENSALTVQGDGMINVVFEQRENNQSIIIQAIEVPSEKTNVKIRLKSL